MGARVGARVVPKDLLGPRDRHPRRRRLHRRLHPERREAEREPRRDARADRYIPDLSFATVSPADAEAVSLAPGEHLSCELDLGFRDAALVVGCTPPPSRYFGVTPHLYREYSVGGVSGARRL